MSPISDYRTGFSDKDDLMNNNGRTLPLTDYTASGAIESCSLPSAEDESAYEYAQYKVILHNIQSQNTLSDRSIFTPVAFVPESRLGTA